MKTLFRRIWHCWWRDYHWASAVHGYYPAQWANCSCCGKVLFGPHHIEDIVSPTAKRDLDRAVQVPR